MITSPHQAAVDTLFMTKALAAAFSQWGRTAPNPSVGCVIARRGRIWGIAATADGGHPHAEAQALAQAGDKAIGATAYVTLEPCFARSRIDAVSCTSLLLQARISRCVVAMADPHPLASGQGLDALRQAGIVVDIGIGGDHAADLYAGFVKRLRTGLPFVAIDTQAIGYDALFTLMPNETLREALQRLGASGMNRVYTPAGSSLAAGLSAEGLVDADYSAEV